MNPAQFEVEPPDRGPVPEFAAQSEAIRLELELDWDRVAALKAAGAVTETTSPSAGRPRPRVG